MTDVFKAALDKDPRLRLPLRSFNQLLRDRRLWTTGQTFDDLDADVPATVRDVLRGALMDGDFAARAWFEADGFDPWWESLEPLISGLYALSNDLRRKT